MKYTICLYLLLCTGILNSFSQEAETRKLEPFKKISAFGSIEIILVKGDKESVTLESSTVELSDVKTTIEENTLKLSIKDKMFSGRRHVKAKVTYVNVNQISINAGVELECNDTLSSESLTINTGSGATANAIIKATDFEANVGQGATLSLSGICKSQIVEAGTGGVYSAYDLISENGDIKANTGGIAKVNVKKKLKAAASTGGSVSYRGEPASLSRETILGGSIDQVVE